MDGCTGFTASDCMIFTMDDCICPHALNAAGNGEPQANDYTFKNMVLYNVDAGNGIRIGASFETSKVQNWIFQDIYVLAHRGAALYADHSDWAEINNLQVINFSKKDSSELGKQASRLMKLQVNIQDGNVMVSVDDNIINVTPVIWKNADH